MITFLPFMRARSERREGTGGTDSAAYCYSVWLRHLVLANRHGFEGVPRSVVELGPGDSIGIGLAAVLSGAGSYSGLDVIDYDYTERTIRIFDELVELFRARSPIPGPEKFPQTKPFLNDYRFPEQILNHEVLGKSLAPERIACIRTILEQKADKSKKPRILQANETIRISYIVPWNESSRIVEDSADFVISQAVMEYVQDLAGAYRILKKWLRPGGMMSHQIDFKSDGITVAWNGHWKIPQWEWILMNGRKAVILNRQPCSEHLRLIRGLGLDVTYLETYPGPEPGIARRQLARQFKAMSDEDLHTAGAFIQAINPPV